MNSDDYKDVVEKMTNAELIRLAFFSTEDEFDHLHYDAQTECIRRLEAMDGMIPRPRVTVEQGGYDELGMPVGLTVVELGVFKIDLYSTGIYDITSPYGDRGESLQALGIQENNDGK